MVEKHLTHILRPQMQLAYQGAHFQPYPYIHFQPFDGYPAFQYTPLLIDCLLE